MTRRAELKASLRLAPQPKLACHPQFAAHLAGERVYPVGVEVSPSGVCNASCPSCFYIGGELGGHRKVFLDTDRACRFLSECATLGVRAVTWTGGGEPTLHPDFGTLVAAAATIGLDQGLFTNALAAPRYDPRYLDWVRVTMTDRPYKPEVIKQLRPTKTLSFAFNYRGPEDDDYLRETLDLAIDVRADYVQVRPALKFHGATTHIDPPAFTHPLMHVTEYKFREARHKHGYATCEAYHFVPFLWEDGNLDVCAYNRLTPGYTLGNIYQAGLKEILDAAPASVPVHDGCQVCCKLNEANLLVHSARALEDRNFP